MWALPIHPTCGVSSMILKQWSILVGAVGLSLGLASWLLVRPLLTSAPDRPVAAAQPPPIITVEAVYPGASAHVVADAVAAPIEQQVNGVLNMRWMRSQSRNDGTYRLNIAFEPRVDLDLAKVLV